MYAQMEIVVPRARKERRGKNEALACYTNTGVLQCYGERKSEINRMFIEQLFAGAISASTAASTSANQVSSSVKSTRNVASPFYNETRHLQDVQTITAERTTDYVVPWESNHACFSPTHRRSVKFCRENFR